MSQETLLGFGSIEEHVRDGGMSQEEGFEIVRDFRGYLNVSVQTGFAYA